LGFGDQITGDKGYFSGGRVLLSQHQKGQEKRLYSLNCAGHDVPSGTQLASKRSDDALGVATSMCYSPTLQAYVGLCKLTQSVAVPMALEARARRLNGRIESGGRVQVWAKNPGLLKKADSNAS
jgi:glycine cleavage system aminomethyltransferase T